LPRFVVRALRLTCRVLRCREAQAALRYRSGSVESSQLRVCSTVWKKRKPTAQPRPEAVAKGSSRYRG